jgi:hypothetical protein
MATIGPNWTSWTESASIGQNGPDKTGLYRMDKISQD